MMNGLAVRLSLLALLASAQLIACSSDEDATQDPPGNGSLIDDRPALPVPDVQPGDGVYSGVWEPGLLLDDDDTLLSWLAFVDLAVADDFALIDNLELTNETDAPISLTVTLRVVGYSETWSRQISLAANETTTIDTIRPNFAIDRLQAMTSTADATIEFTVSDGTRAPNVYQHAIQILPLNRVRWTSESGEPLDDTIVTLITPDEPGLDTVLREAAEFTTGRAIVGYQGGTWESFAEQVEAVFRALHARDVIYSSVSGSFFDGAQNIRLVRESLANRSANCMDGSILLSAAYERMELRPFLVFVPGHVFMGVCDSSDSCEEALLIETTMISGGDFDAAVESAWDQIDDTCGGEWPDFDASGEQDCFVVMLEDAREAGFRPLPLVR